MQLTLYNPAALLFGKHVPIYDVDEIFRKREMLSDENKILRALYEKMTQRGGDRLLVSTHIKSCLDDLLTICPNFAPVIEHLRGMVSLAVSNRQPTTFTPLLLLGEPGIGKTYFAQMLATRLGMSFHFISMDSLTASWLISGGSSQWKEAKMGKVASALIEGQFANPLFLVDEIDKAREASQYDPIGPFHTLLEPTTAELFVDEYVEVKTNARHAQWIMTANSTRGLPAPFLDRLDVWEIRSPTFEEARCIALRVYVSMLTEKGFLGHPKELADEVLDFLATKSPRVMYRTILRALGVASLAGRKEIMRADFFVSPDTKKHSMGFVQ